MLRRILLFTGLTLIVMLVFISFATRTVLREGFSTLEKGLVETNLARVQNAIADEISSLGATTSAWASWDETYRFVVRRNGSYVESNIRSGMFSNLDLDLVLLLDTRGALIYGATLDPLKGVRQGVPPGLMGWLAAHPPLTGHANTSSGAEGIIQLPEGPLLAAARLIMDPRRARGARGTLLMGRFLDDREASRLSRSLKLTISFLPLNPAVAAQGPATIDDHRGDVISGSAVLKAIDGSPAVLVRVQFPRDIHRQADTTARYFIMWLFVIGVVFSAVVLLVIQLTVLSRLQQLSAGVLSIGTGSKPGKRVAVKGRDQIAYLGAAINGMLEALEGSTDQLRRSEQRNQAFLDAIPDLILRVSRDGTVIDANLPAHYRLAMQTSTLKGARLEEIAARYPFLPQNLLTDGPQAIQRALTEGAPVVLRLSLDPGSGTQHFQASIAASGDAEVIVIVREVTSEKRVEETQRHDILVKEIHHRVKNNLQVISSLLGLQASAAQDPQTRALLNESRDRVRSMALIHEKLFQSSDGSGGGYAQYVRDLADQLLKSYKGDSSAVAIDSDVADIPMDLDLSVPVGLIVNEFLTNALAHAFPPGRSGRISVRLRRAADGRAELSVTDDGVGFPQEIDYRNPTSLGLRIVNILVQQIRGTLTLERKSGTSFSITFPIG